MNKMYIEEAIPASYYDEDTYMVSQSQHKSKKSCERSFLDGYINRYLGIYVSTTPLVFGNYFHDIMENVMKFGIGDRMENHIRVFEKLSLHQPPNFPVRLMKSIDHVKVIFEKYDQTAKHPIDRMAKRYKKFGSTELHVAVRGPNSWFSDLKGFDTVLKGIELSNGVTPEFDGFGVRGKIDYYGKDQINGKIYLVDWKSGKYNEYYMEPYIKQLKIYAYIAYILKIPFDGMRIEYLEARETVDIEFDLDESREIVKDMLRDVAKAMLKPKTPENFPRTFDDFRCKNCKFELTCQQDRSPITLNAFKGLNYARY